MNTRINRLFAVVAVVFAVNANAEGIADQFEPAVDSFAHPNEYSGQEVVRGQVRGISNSVAIANPYSGQKVKRGQIVSDGHSQFSVADINKLNEASPAASGPNL